MAWGEAGWLPEGPTMRIGLGGVMTIVVLVAIGFASLREDRATSGIIVFNLVVAMLLTASLAARFSATPEMRARWLGFALFGAAHLILAATGYGGLLLTSRAANAIGVYYSEHYGRFRATVVTMTNDLRAIRQEQKEIHDLVMSYSTILVAALGWFISGILHRRLERTQARPGV
jgi:hypothetical protein